MATNVGGKTDPKDIRRLWLGRLAPACAFAVKLAVSLIYLNYYLPRFARLMYIADGPARGIEAYRLAFAGFAIFPTHQFPPLPLWIWAALQYVWHDIYFTGTAMNVVAGAGAATFLYLLGRRLAGPAAGAIAAVLFTFSPVHHNLTLSMGMAEPVFYLWLTAGIYFAVRGEAGLPGATAAVFCFAAAALSRYEGTAFLVLYSAYRLIRRRPRNAAGWVLFALPLLVAGAFVTHKGLQPSTQGLWPALAGVRADTAKVLPDPTWYRRLGYGVYRLLYDGRASTVFAFAGVILVFRRPWRTPDRILIWLGWALMFFALMIIAGVVGLGLCPERYFATPLMLMFPFAGLAVVALTRFIRPPAKLVKGAAVTIVLLVAAVITFRWDSVIKKPGYGYRGPCLTHPAYVTETALTLRDLWRNGELGPQEVVLIEIRDAKATGVWRYEEYPLRAFSDHPLHFLRDRRNALRTELPYLVPLMRENDIRIAILMSDESRKEIKQYYNIICPKAMVYENPTQTIVVLREGWTAVPDFASRKCRDLVTVYDVPPGGS